jgi:hypothetical protein
MSLTSYQAAPPRDPANAAYHTGDVRRAQALIFYAGFLARGGGGDGRRPEKIHQGRPAEEKA